MKWMKIQFSHLLTIVGIHMSKKRHKHIYNQWCIDAYIINGAAYNDKWKFNARNWFHQGWLDNSRYHISQLLNNWTTIKVWTPGRLCRALCPGWKSQRTSSSSFASRPIPLSVAADLLPPALQDQAVPASRVGKVPWLLTEWMEMNQDGWKVDYGGRKLMTLHKLGEELDNE